MAACLTSLVTQDYANLKIIAIDDRSSDATGGIMDGLAKMFPDRLRVVHIAELPEGWLGKPHAMAVGARRGHHDDGCGVSAVYRRRCVL